MILAYSILVWLQKLYLASFIEFYNRRELGESEMIEEWEADKRMKVRGIEKRTSVWGGAEEKKRRRKSSFYYKINCLLSFIYFILPPFYDLSRDLQSWSVGEIEYFWTNTRQIHKGRSPQICGQQDVVATTDRQHRTLYTRQIIP